MSDVTTDTMMHSVTAGIAVDIAEEGFDRVSAILSGIPGGANRAVGSALARAAAAGKTVAKRAVTQEYAISSSEFPTAQRISTTSSGAAMVRFPSTSATVAALSPLEFSTPRWTAAAAW